MRASTFFDWCGNYGLTRVSDISKTFRLSSQTVRNWRKNLSDAEKPSDPVLDFWVDLACVALVRNGVIPPIDKVFPLMGAGDLLMWELKHSFDTYEKTGNVFNIRRQAVHNWHKRGSFPKWLPFACAGYDRIRAGDIPEWYLDVLHSSPKSDIQGLPRWIVEIIFPDEGQSELNSCSSS